MYTIEHMERSFVDNGCRSHTPDFDNHMWCNTGVPQPTQQLTKRLNFPPLLPDSFTELTGQ